MAQLIQKILRFVLFWLLLDLVQLVELLFKVFILVDGFLVDDLDCDELTVTALCRIGNGLVILTILEVELLHVHIRVVRLQVFHDLVTALFRNGCTSIPLGFIQFFLWPFQAILSEVAKVAGRPEVRVHDVRLVVSFAWGAGGTYGALGSRHQGSI